MNFQTNHGTKISITIQLKKFRNTGTVNRLTGSSRPRNACTKVNVDLVKTVWFWSRRYAADLQNSP